MEKCSEILKKEKSDIQKSCEVEVRLAVPKDDLFASERAESFERATEMVMDDLKKLLQKRKDKMKQPRQFRNSIREELIYVN